MAEEQSNEQIEMNERLLGVMLRIPFDEISRRVNEALAAAGYGDIRPAHQNVLLHLPFGGGRITDLAERAQITKQSMSALVHDLEKHGYLERAPDPTDRRAMIFFRTDRGWAVERTARAAIRELEAEWAARLGEQRLQQLRTLLNELAAIVETDF